MVKFIEAVLMLSGMIIGAGMFAIPFSFVRAGFWLGTGELAVLGSVILAIHLLYGEIVLKTPARHRLPGYVQIYLGRRAAYLAWGSALFGMTGALLAYIVIGALFLKTIVPTSSPGAGEFFWALLFAAGGALVTSLPLRKEAFINGLLTVLLVLFIIILSFSLVPKISDVNLSGFRGAGFFAPYGVLLFALTGATAIPELVALLGNARRRARGAIVAGSVIPVLVYFLFALSVVGASGSQVSAEAIQGLGSIAGSQAVRLGSIIGFLAVFTSYVVLSISLQSLLRLDLGLPRRAGYLLVSGVPFLLYVSGLQNFIAIIGAVGAVSVGVDAALILGAYNRMRRGSGRSRSLWPALFEIAAYCMVGGGAAVYIWQLFR